MKKFIPILVLCTIIPQLAFASWWNPLSWKIFKKSDTKTQIINVEKDIKSISPNTQVATSSKEKTELEMLKKDNEKLKMQVEAERLQAEKVKIEARLEQVKAEKVKAEAERARIEIEKAKINAEPKTFTLPSGVVVDKNGNILESFKRNEVSVESAKIENIISFEEIKGSYQNRTAEAYFRAKNESNTEAHIAQVNFKINGYGFSPNNGSDINICFRDNLQTYGCSLIELNVKDSKTPFSVVSLIEFEKPLIIYEKSHQDFTVFFYSKPNPFILKFT
jgi:SHS2 domain-containing protein